MADGGRAPELMGKALVDALEGSGFTAVEEYTDFESSTVSSSLAVWSIDSVRLEGAGESINDGRAAVRAEIVFKVMLMGHFGVFDDREEFNGHCFDACSRLACMRELGKVSVELGKCGADMRQKRLVRELEAVFKVYMKEAAEGSV